MRGPGPGAASPWCGLTGTRGAAARHRHQLTPGCGHREYLLLIDYIETYSQENVSLRKENPYTIFIGGVNKICQLYYMNFFSSSWSSYKMVADFLAH